MGKLVTVLCAILLCASQQVAFSQGLSFNNEDPINKKNVSDSQPEVFDNILLLSNSKLSEGEILLMNSSHQDLAWMDLLEKCILDRDTKLITPLLKAAEKDPGYRFDIEDVLMIKEYIGRHPESKAKIIKMLKDGRLSCGSTYQMPYEEMYSGESLVRQFYLGARWAKENLEGYLPDTYWNPDVPGRTMQMPQIMAKSGTENMLMSRHEKGVFRWYSPDGSYVNAYSPGHYYNDSHYLMEIDPVLDKLAEASLFWEKGYNDKSGFKPVIGVLSDRDMLPAVDYSQLISKWNNLDSYKNEKGELIPLTLPKIRYVLAPEFIDKIVKSSSNLKKITGGRPAVWLYIHGPSHEWALKASREGDIMMTNAEKFSTIDALLQGSFRNYPKERLNKAWEDKIYPDHGWGGNGGESTDAIFLSKFVGSLNEANSITNDALKNISSKVKTNRSNGIPVLVFNSLSWERDDPTSFTINFDQGKALDIKLTDATGNDVPVQLSGVERYTDNSLKSANAIFIARKIPSIGYKTYYVVPQMTVLSNNNDNNQNEIETPFYRIELGKGGVKSIFDKELKVELLKTTKLSGGDVFTMKSVGSGAGEFADVQQPTMEGFDKVSDHSAKWEIIENGLVYTTFKLRQPIRNAIVETNLVVYHKLKKIDFETSLLNWEGVLYREYRFALPLNMKNGKVSYEVPFGVLEVGKDEIEGAAGERYTTNCADVHPRGIENWIGASDDKFGVTLSSSTAVADYIDPTGLAEDALLLQPIMLASRRSCHGKGNEFLQTGNHYFHFSLTSHKPGYENGYKFGRQSNEKLLVVVDPEAGKITALPEENSFFSVDASNISISTIKKAEDDNEAVIRLFETGIGETNVNLSSWFNVANAKKTNMLEYEGQVIDFKSNHVPVTMGSHAIETIKLKVD
jgi:alpha-mannosidase